FLLLNIEIADYFSRPDAAALTFQFSGNFARDMSYSIAWALFALLLLIIGIRQTVRPGDMRVWDYSALPSSSFSCTIFRNWISFIESLHSSSSQSSQSSHLFSINAFSAFLQNRPNEIRIAGSQVEQ